MSSRSDHGPASERRLTVAFVFAALSAGAAIGLAAAAILGSLGGRWPWWPALLAGAAAAGALVLVAWRFGRAVRAIVHPLLDERRRLEELRRDFVANVSHELKTPLTAARGLVETILDDAEMAPALRSRYLEKVRDHTHQMSELVSDLIALSRLEAAVAPRDPARLDLRAIAIEAVRVVKATAEQRGIEIRLSLGAEPLVTAGDEAALEQAVVNLLDNAIKYSPPGGAIDLALAAENAHLVLAVRDSGPGIAAEHQQRIFERFYRADRARSRELGGTGLGLAIVKHTALQHGGDASVESAPGSGSTFRLRLPRAG